jgi:hypothetical protein
VSRRVTRLLLPALVLSASFGCDGGTRVGGRVRNKAGYSLSDVAVTLQVDGRDRVVRTDSQGRYLVSTLHSPFNVKEKLRFDKPGYVTHEIEFNSHDELHELDVTLVDDVQKQSK